MSVAEKEAALAGCIRQVATQTSESALALGQSLQPDATEIVHKIRVSLKRLRASWYLLRFSVVRETRGASNRRLKQAGRLLSVARDVSVMRQSLAQYASDVTDNSPDLQLDRDAVASLLRQESDAWRTVGLEFGHKKPISKALRVTYRRARKLGRAAKKESASAELRHQWRKWVKYLYYQLEILRRCGLREHSQVIERLDLLGTLLGREHDLELLVSHLSSESTTDTGGLMDKVANEQKAIREKTDHLFSVLFQAKPGGFVSSVIGAVQ